MRETRSSIVLSIVIPCLNEANTIGKAIEWAMIGIQKTGALGEVIVVDNDSADSSAKIASRHGARVIHGQERGYGAAIDAGVQAARGAYILFADADLSYPLYDAHLLLKPLINGNTEFVLGSRLKGSIQKGAMPTLNKHLGTPILSWLIRSFFGLKTTDCNSGMRAFVRSKYNELNLTCPGMEYASEMLIRVAEEKINYLEIPITFLKDQRNSVPHLKRWRDGWRHLRLILACAPTARTALLPCILSALALFGALVISYYPILFPNRLVPYHTAIVFIALASPLSMISVTLILVRISLQLSNRRITRVTQWMERICDRAIPFYLSGFFFIASIYEILCALWKWLKVDFGELNEITTMIRVIVFALIASILFATDMGYGLIQLSHKKKYAN